MDKDVVYTDSEIFLSHEKKGNLSICNNVDESRGHYAK